VQTARIAHKASSIDIILDVGPQPTIWSNMQSPEFSGKTRLAFTGKRGKDQIVAMLTAFSSLFEKGFTMDFQELYGQTSHKFVMTDVPTYPFQRLHNYPAYIPTRAEFIGIAPQRPEPKSWAPAFVVDQALCDFLDLHRIEGRRVLPGAAMVDFFARAAPSKTVKNIRFQIPLVLETPKTQVRAETDGSGAYKLVLQEDANTQICSGFISDKPTPYSPKKLDKEPEMVPLQMMSKEQIYECFKNVQFGEPFRTVQEVRIWADHAAGDVKITTTGNADHDRIRKLDACLHMFGAVTARVAPKMDESAGAYLPASIEDFVLHTDDLPYSFTCRYHLPLEVGRNARVLSASFDVISETGALLVSCRKYSVAWVPRGVVHKEQKSETANVASWHRNGWTTQKLPSQQTSAHTFDELLYLGNGASSRVLTTLSSSAKDVICVELQGLPQGDTGRANENIKWLASNHIDILPSVLRGKDTLVVLDLTKANNSPGSEEFISLCHQVFSFLKMIPSQEIRFSKFLILTAGSTPVDLYREGLNVFSDCKTSSTSLVGSVVQGMVRVFCQESCLETSPWVLDLPSLDILKDDRLREILVDEIQRRQTSAHSHNFVSYREDSSNQSFSRFVPVLEPIEPMPSRVPSGTTVIVGIDGIGKEMASALIQSGCDTVVFFGQTPEGYQVLIFYCLYWRIIYGISNVQNVFASLPEKMRSKCQYRQVDMRDLLLVKATLLDINSAHGGIKNIIHTTTPSTITSLDTAIRSLVSGTWNLHVASQELNLSLDTFALFSSAE